MRLLLTGDIHIGRTSTRLPPGAGAQGFRAADAWERIVEMAIEERVALVLLSGDVTDRENGFWEAVGPLERGIARLARQRIRTIAVAGNHDFSVLARLAETLDPAHFTLIGRGGAWERITIEADGRPRLHIDGWSFPSERVIESPLLSYALRADATAPILGIVHGDLDVAETLYAPLHLARLRERPPQGWLLGHIHKPRLIHEPVGAPWVLYPGSPQALDPGEEGVHGVWLVDIEEGHLGVPRSRPLSSVVYEHVDVDITSITSPDRLEPHLNAAIHDAVSRVVDEVARAGGTGAGQIVLRLRVRGETAHTASIATSLEALRRAAHRVIADREVVVDRVVDATSPAIQLAEAAKSTSALGAVARLLVLLGEGDGEEPTSGAATSGTATSGAAPSGAAGTTDPAGGDEIARLIEDTRRDLEQLVRSNAYSPLDRGAPTKAEARAVLRRQARRLLSELVGQLPEGSIAGVRSDEHHSTGAIGVAGANE